MRKARGLFACVVASAVLAVGPTAAVSQEPTSPDVIGKVKIVEFAFQPSTITVSQGTIVGWKNFGTLSHTSTSDNGFWNSGTLQPGDIFGVRFRRTGTFGYHCSIHPNMTGTVVVN